jgi:hypothetical protein
MKQCTRSRKGAGSTIRNRIFRLQSKLLYHLSRMYAREIWRAFIKIKEIFLFYDPHEFSTTCELPVVLSQIRTSMPGSTEIKSVSTGEAFSGRFADSSTTSSAGFEFWDEF